jgi:hypothetical protein
MSIFRWRIYLKKIFILFLVVFISTFNLHSIVIVPAVSHQHFGEVVFIESHYNSDSVSIGSEKEFAKKNLINAVTNTKYDSHYVDNYSNEPLYYREVESLYKYSGCGHCFTAIRVEILDEKVSDKDTYKWDRKHSKHWYQNYNWETDEYEINGLFGLFCIAILILVSILFGAIATLWEEKHPEPSIEFKYNLEIGQYERINNLLEKRSKLDEFF